MAGVTFINRNKLLKNITFHFKTMGQGIAWLEVPAMTVIAFVLAWLLDPQDPLTLNRDFPWVILAPLLAGLRYGFSWGAISSSLLVTCGWFHAQWFNMQWHSPVSWLLGTMAVSTIAGEFRDQWQQKLAALYQANHYRKARMNEFTKSYQLLKRSHALLEQDVALNGFSLYGAIADIKNQLMSYSGEYPILKSCANDLLQLLGHYGEIQVAAIIEVNDGCVNTEPIASYGDMPAILTSDSLLKKSIINRQALCIDPIEIYDSNIAGKTDLLGCIPFIDSSGDFHAILVIHLMPFECVNENHISRLGVICGHVADYLYLKNMIDGVGQYDAEILIFHAHLQRCWQDAVDYNINAGLVAVKVGNFGIAPALKESIAKNTQALDIVISLKSKDESDFVLIVLMPLSSQDEVFSFINDFPDFLHRYHKINMEKAETTLNYRILQSGECSLQSCSDFLRENCYPIPDIYKSMNRREPC